MMVNRALCLCVRIGCEFVPVGVDGALSGFERDTLAVFLHRVLKLASLHQIVTFLLQQSETCLGSPGCEETFTTSTVRRTAK